MKIEALKKQLIVAGQPDTKRFHTLMARRVKTILMVSTQYEAFSLAWDGSLTEDIYGTYSLLHLQNVPQITTVLSAREALDKLRHEKYDLVLVSSNLSDMPIAEFGQAVKATLPGLPVAVLFFALAGLPAAAHNTAFAGVDFVFSWQGSAKVLLSIIKLVEDHLNIDRDIQIVRIGVIMVIEDSVKQYSFFLPHLYAILMKHAFSRVPFGIDENERQLRTRTRPKIILARTFKEAEEMIARYKPFLHGVISDLQIAGEEEPHSQRAGTAFLRRLLQTIPGLPVLLMSADETAPKLARALGIRFADKQSPRFVRQLEDFCLEHLGFGDFVFRDQNGQEISRVHNLREFENALKTVPDETIEFHSRRNQFSHWLLAQGESRLAELIRPLQIADLGSSAEMRRCLREMVALIRREKHRGTIADFRADDFEPDYGFLMTGRGSLGGKARGLAFMFQLMNHPAAERRKDGIEIMIPPTLVITTDAFDSFMAANDLYAFAMECRDDTILRERFLQAQLPEKLTEQLRAYIGQVRAPLAVRSSSHMEDSSEQPFAGLYHTCMIPNQDPDDTVRLHQLVQSVKLVYASVYTASIKSYFKTLKLNMEEEKMAVIIQKAVGRQYGNLFYPAISGVAQSFNFYPFARMEPEDGVACVALGFGKTVVEGGEALRFCPRYPTVLPQASAIADLLQVSQKQFYAMDLAGQAPQFAFGRGADLKTFGLERAEQDQTLHAVGSVISDVDDTLVDDLYAPGRRVVTFAPILKHRSFPLSELLQYLLQIGKASIGSDVEIEFALNMDFLPDTKPEFYLLQMRPMVNARERTLTAPRAFHIDRAICACKKIMGNGLIENIRDVIYCHPSKFDFARSRQAAETIGRLNQSLLDAGRRYILIGPGRWGTRMPSLGIPVNWQQVAGAVVIVETEAQGKRIDLSQGSHFFHNLAATGIGYFSILESDAENFVRWEALDAMQTVYDDQIVRHARADEPIFVQMDALRHCGIIAMEPKTA